MIVVDGTLGLISRNLRQHLKDTRICNRMRTLQKSTTLKTTAIMQKGNLEAQGPGRGPNLK